LQLAITKPHSISLTALNTFEIGRLKENLLGTYHGKAASSASQKRARSIRRLKCR
jgi:hypothetical protein